MPKPDFSLSAEILVDYMLKTKDSPFRRDIEGRLYLRCDEIVFDLSKQKAYLYWNGLKVADLQVEGLSKNSTITLRNFYAETLLEETYD